MRILQANFHTKWGGQAAVVFNLSRALARRGHEVTVAVPADSNLARRAAEAGLEVFDKARFFARGFLIGIISDSRQIARLLRARQFDVVHTNGSKDGWAVTFAVRGTGVPVVTVRTRHNLKRIRRHPGNRWFYGAASDHVVAVSNAIKEHTVASGLCPEGKVTVIHPALDLDAFQPSTVLREQFRRELRLADDQFAIGTSARLEVQKGIDLLLRGFQRVAREEPRAVLVVAGYGKEAAALEALARELGIADRVRFCGFRSDMPAVLAGLDLFALTSRTEGFGVALVEAMAMSLPAVATRVGGVTDIVTDGVDGALVSHGDGDQLAAAILSLMRDPEARRRLGQAAFQRARSFTPEATAERHEALYRRLIEQKKL